jgi:uncharacterized Tic20 family protein
MANEVPEPTPAADVAADGAPTSDERTMAMICHLGALIPTIGFLCPLIIWLMKKDQSKFVDDQGKESLNFQITIFFGNLVGWILMFILIGIFVLGAVWLLNIIFCIIAGLAANKGEKYRYPFAIRLIN